MALSLITASGQEWTNLGIRRVFQFEAIARQRGIELLGAVVAAWPALQEISLTKGFGAVQRCMLRLPPGGDREQNLTQVEYGLLPAFLDGIMSGMAQEEARRVEIGQPRMSLTENYEDYYLHTRAAFQATFAMAKVDAAALSREQDLFEKYYHVGFGQQRPAMSL